MTSMSRTASSEKLSVYPPPHDGASTHANTDCRIRPGRFHVGYLLYRHVDRHHLDHLMDFSNFGDIMADDAKRNKMEISAGPDAEPKNPAEWEAGYRKGYIAGIQWAEDRIMKIFDKS